MLTSAHDLEARLLAAASGTGVESEVYAPGPPSLEQLRGRVTDLQELFSALRQDNAAYSLPNPAKIRVRDLERIPCPDNVDQASRLLSDVLKFFARLCRDEVFHKLQPPLRRRVEAQIAAVAAAASAGHSPIVTDGDASSEQVHAQFRTWPAQHLCPSFSVGERCVLRYSAAGTTLATVDGVDMILSDDPKKVGGTLRLSVTAPLPEERHPAADAEAEKQLHDLGRAACTHLPLSMLEGKSDLLAHVTPGAKVIISLDFTHVGSHVRPLVDEIGNLQGLPGMDKFLALQEPKALAVGPPREDGGCRVWSAGGAKWGCKTQQEAERQAFDRCRDRLESFGEATQANAFGVDLLWRASWGPAAAPLPTGAVERRWVLGEWRRRGDLPKSIGTDLMNDLCLWEQGGQVTRDRALQWQAAQGGAAAAGGVPRPLAGSVPVQHALHALDPGSGRPPSPPPRSSKDAGTAWAVSHAPAVAGSAAAAGLQVPAAAPPPFGQGMYVEVFQRPRLAPALEGRIGYVRQWIRGRVCVEFSDFPPLKAQTVALRANCLRTVTPVEADQLLKAARVRLDAAAQQPEHPFPAAPPAAGRPQPPAPPAPEKPRTQFNPSATPFVVSSATASAGRKNSTGGEEGGGNGFFARVGGDAARDFDGEAEAAFRKPREQRAAAERGRAQGGGASPPPVDGTSPSAPGAAEADSSELSKAKGVKDEWQQEWALQAAEMRRKAQERKAGGETYAKAAKMLRSVLLPGADCGRRPFAAGRGKPVPGSPGSAPHSRDSQPRHPVMS